jgi:hypothetical protein
MFISSFKTLLDSMAPGNQDALYFLKIKAFFWKHF